MKIEIKPIAIDTLPEYRGLDVENADNYFRAGQRSAFIYSEVINPFETSLKESCGYSDNNIPKKETTESVSAGNWEFSVRATPTTKRAGYKEIVEDVQDFLETRFDLYTNGERPMGITTIDNEPYIAVRAVRDKIKQARGSGAPKGVRLKITERPPILPSTSMVVPLGMDHSKLTEGNTMRYLEALNLNNNYANFIEGFERDLLGLTGFSDEFPPEEMEHMYKRLGEHVFHVKSVPYSSMSWGKVLGGLEKAPPKRNPENGGDLTLINEGIRVPRLEAYQTRTRQGEPIIQLNTLLSRLDDLKDDNTCTKVRQKPIIHYPLV